MPLPKRSGEVTDMISIYINVLLTLRKKEKKNKQRKSKERSRSPAQSEPKIYIYIYKINSIQHELQSDKKIIKHLDDTH